MEEFEHLSSTGRPQSKPARRVAGARKLRAGDSSAARRGGPTCWEFLGYCTYLLCASSTRARKLPAQRAISERSLPPCPALPMLCLLGARTSFLTTPMRRRTMASSARLARRPRSSPTRRQPERARPPRSRRISPGAPPGPIPPRLLLLRQGQRQQYAGTAYYGTSNAVEAPLTGRLTAADVRGGGGVGRGGGREGTASRRSRRAPARWQGRRARGDLAWGSAGSYGTKLATSTKRAAGARAGKACGTRGVAEAPLTGGPKLRLLQDKVVHEETFTKEELDAAVAEATKDLFTQEEVAPCGPTSTARRPAATARRWFRRVAEQCTVTEASRW